MISSQQLSKSFKRNLRAIRIWKTFLLLIFYLWWDAQKITYIWGFQKSKQSFRQGIRAKWLTKELLKLGSAFIKLGQLLSARPDILPKAWIEELASLQDKVPPFEFKKAQEILKKELGSHCKEIIHIDKKPLGAASLAQVHKGILRNGREVVFKIQRPGLETFFRLDLEVMQEVATLLQKNKNWSQGRDWVGMAKECKKVLLRELNFQIEAQYAARFRQQFLEVDEIKVPGIIWEMTTEKVICMDYLRGIKINDQQGLLDLGIQPRTIAEIGASSYFKQLIEFGFFHADPHPGNLAVSSEGCLIFYDFGMMGMVSEKLRNNIGAMVRSVALKDASLLVKQLQETGLLASGIDLGPVRRLVRVMLNETLTPPFDSTVINKLSGDLYELVYGKPFRLPVELIFVMRALSTFEGVGRTLDSSFNLVAIAQPYLIPLMTSENSNPNDLINEIGRQVGELGSRAVTFPKRLDESLEKLEQGDLQLQIRIGESDRQLRRMINAQQSMSQSILIGCLGIAAALLGSTNKPFLSIVPIVFALPVSMGWIKLQLKMRSEERLERIQKKKGDF